MNNVRNLLIGGFAALVAACSTAPSSDVKPAAASALAAPSVADISGNWILTVQSPQGAIDANMSVIQTGSAIKGKLESAMGTVDYTGSVNGKEVKFSYSIEQFGAPAGSILDYTGTVDGAVMKGNAKFASFGEGEWTAKRP